MTSSHVFPPEGVQIPCPVAPAAERPVWEPLAPATSPGTNTGRGVNATAALVVAITLNTLLGPTPPVAGAGQYPDAGDVVSAYLTVRTWVDDFDPPAPAEAAFTLRNASGVCVILRRGGRVFGTGVDTTGDELMLRRAVGRAIGEVLGSPAVAALPPEEIARAGRAMTLELEVAGPLVPLLGRTFAEIAQQLEPGLDGVALRRGDRVAMLPPARMRATNTTGRIERLLPPLAVELGLNILTLPELARRFDVSLYRFRTTHLAQAAPGDPPFSTLRGDVLVTDDQVTRAAIKDLALGIAEHLAGSMAPVEEPVGLMGTYLPAADRYEPLIAPPPEQALAAWALARYSRVRGLDEEVAARMAGCSGRILDELGRVSQGERDPLTSSVTCATIVQAFLEHGFSREGDEAPPLFLQAAATVRDAWKPTGFVDVEEGLPVAPHAQALIVSAMSRLLSVDHMGFDAAVVRQAIDAAWDSVPAHRRISLMPWIGWAEADFAAATGQPIAAGPLREMRDLLDASRLGMTARADGADLAGGFSLDPHRPWLATSQSLRPAVLLAWMIRQPAITPPDETQAALGRMLQTVRFVMQLAVRDSLVWSCPDPRRALGGIRTATWDWDQPVPAQALGLATATETLLSLDAVAGE